MKTNQEPFRILLIEDNPDHVHLLKRFLRESSRITHADTLAAGIELHAVEPFDVTILDLTLPDSRGIQTLTRFRKAVSESPVIITTGDENEETAIQSLRMGAQDYLVKGTINGDMFNRAVRYAVERQRLAKKLSESRERERRLREMKTLTRLSADPEARITAETFGELSLQKRYPDIYEQLIKRYQALLETALEAQSFQVETTLTEDLRALAEKLGYLRALPRDVVNIHTAAMEGRTEGSNPERTTGYLEEGRLMVLELMGHLAAYYRNASAGFR
jgi:DNA-binding response OmpR family regulator